MRISDWSSDVCSSDLLDRFRREGIHMAVMVDEYGTTEGIATLTDVLESIAGDLPERGELTEPLIVRRSDGSWLVAGTLPIDEFEDRFSLPGLQGDGGFHTLAGFEIGRASCRERVCQYV